MALNVHGWCDLKNKHPDSPVDCGVNTHEGKYTLSQHFSSCLILCTYLDMEASTMLLLSFVLDLRSPFSCLIPSPFALFAEEGVKWFSEGSYLMHPPPPPPPLLLSGPALLNMLQHGQKARLRVTATESGSVFVDKLYLNRGQRCSETSSTQHITIR